MTAPKIGGREMVESRHTSDARRAPYQWKTDAGPFSVVAAEVTPGNHWSAVYFKTRDDNMIEASHQNVQSAANAASAYLRNVALEILDAVDPEAGERARCGACRECMHHDGRYCCRRDDDCVLAEVTDEGGFCHRFERKTW